MIRPGTALAATLARRRALDSPPDREYLVAAAVSAAHRPRPAVRAWVWDAPPPERWRTAAHEAGHAVVSRRLGAVVEEVSVTPDGSTQGRTTITAAGAWLDPVAQGVIIAAGVAAADLLAPGGPHAGVAHPGDLELLDELEPRWREVYLPVAQKVVTRLRPEVEAVAAALVERRTLDAGELDALLAPSGSYEQVADNLARWGWT